jgi:hypothetical protein
MESQKTQIAKAILCKNKAGGIKLLDFIYITKIHQPKHQDTAIKTEM